MKTIIVTGCSGQLSQYLIKYLQENVDLNIVGTVRHKSKGDSDFIFDQSKVKFELMDLSDTHSIENLILKYKPEYFCNNAANAYVGESWGLPEQQFDLNTLGVLRELEAIRKHSPHTRYFNMGTSEEFACVENNGTQNEDTKIYPRSPYGCAKAASRYVVSVWRNSYNLYALQGWTFNFESKLRGEKYLTRKVTKAVARIYHAIKAGKPFEPLEVGNIYSNRSWQHASDVARGVWMQLNQDTYRKDVNKLIEEYDKSGKLLLPRNVNPTWITILNRNIKEYVLSASDTHTVKEFIEKCFAYAHIEIIDQNPDGIEPSTDPKGQQVNYTLKDGTPVVVVSRKFYRPLDVTFLHGDASRIKRDMGWEPTVSFNEIIAEMMEWDINNP